MFTNLLSNWKQWVQALERFFGTDGLVGRLLANPGWQSVIALDAAAGCSAGCVDSGVRYSGGCLDICLSLAMVKVCYDTESRTWGETWTMGACGSPAIGGEFSLEWCP
jgi:hypothetical protein